ncbi:allantoate deiminase [Staphylococcus massiliensis]|uniref:Allantoate amidohydrolase n=1 Tax=Staphylococcus massiliensis S46 TaxID=1229783 RepID=K9B5L6_9STAP|nr:allantoate deiminase [Staphylococcus massiliensis]EKU50122.1 allantoate amidohydrolase [Staphylococcus massiliensis S46]MCG3402175.1 allantoate deiminase [Staphylococcus massiliensis]MCG3412859.1 allantoate deiminase [Staphylococcus massiliensis]POA00179.1 allantoate deiminase [Staphylococcus massiliensis CCUG 55927]
MNIKQAYTELDRVFTSFGGLENGGITRLLYTKEWEQAINHLKLLLKNEDFEVRSDDIGNLIGRIEGTTHHKETIMAGSHIDTVVEGGHLDGQYGILAAFLAMKYLKDTYGKPKRSLELLVLAEEEGSRFPYTFWGSKNFFNIAKPEDVAGITDDEGILFEDAMHKSGYDFRKKDYPHNDLKAFIEMHIEQGKVLEAEEKQIGVVTSIVGQKRYTVKLVGETNHAGTTPMGMRRDVMVAYAEIIQTLTKRAREEGDPLVVTFGQVSLTPNVVNVVPGEIEFTVDTRHDDAAKLKAFSEEVESTIQDIANAHKLNVEMDCWMDEAPTQLDANIVHDIEQAASLRAPGKYKRMSSGGGHDAQIFAQHVPTGMIFVPSIDGISHSPEEDTDIDDLVKGIEVMAEVLYQLAY